MSASSYLRTLSYFVVAASGASAQDLGPFRLASAAADGTPGNGDDMAATRISADGRFVVFSSIATNFAPGDTNSEFDVFVKDLMTGAIERVSVADDGTGANGRCYGCAVSDDGNIVAFASDATNLVTGDTNGVRDVFVRDRAAGHTWRISEKRDGREASLESDTPAVSGDGRFVAFAARADLVAKDHNGNWDIYRYRISDGALTLVSADPAGDTSGVSLEPDIDVDGTHVAFSSTAGNLVPGDINGQSDVFVRDMLQDVTVICSVDSSGHGSNNRSFTPVLNSDGSIVVFTGYGDDLVPGDTNRDPDAFLHELASGVTERISVGSLGEQPDSNSFATGVDGTGRLVTFLSDADNFAGGGYSQRDLFLRDRAAGTTTLLSVNDAGVVANDTAYDSRVSADGRWVTLYTTASNLLVTPNINGVFVRDLAWVAPLGHWFNYGAGWPGARGIPTLTASADPVFATSFTIDVTDSSAFFTAGFLLTGLHEAAIPTRLDGTLLVDFLLLQPFLVPPTGISLAFTVPQETTLCGLEVDCQVIELDPGASHGFSFTPGLALVIGQ